MFKKSLPNNVCMSAIVKVGAPTTAGAIFTLIKVLPEAIKAAKSFKDNIVVMQQMIKDLEPETTNEEKEEVNME